MNLHLYQLNAANPWLQQAESLSARLSAFLGQIFA
jgi:hypothetical protein